MKWLPKRREMAPTILPSVVHPGARQQAPRAGVVHCAVEKRIVARDGDNLDSPRLIDVHHATGRGPSNKGCWDGEKRDGRGAHAPLTVTCGMVEGR